MPSILIVDDEPGIREALALFFQMEGFETRGAADGMRALELQARSPADAIVADVMMPVMDGVTMAEILRERGDPTPVLFMSAFHGRRPGGGVHFLPKPFELDELLDAVAALLDGRG